MARAELSRVLVGLMMLDCLGSSVARAQQQPPPGQFELPPAPEALDPVLGLEVHLGLVFPLARDPLCPPGAECVIGSGVAVGGVIERRWPMGVALGLGYDVWFVDSHGVYELGVMQLLRAQVRYLTFRKSIAHPFGGASVGGLIFGDTLKVAAVGVAVEVMLGVEVELTETIALTLTIPVRFFTTSSFVPRDGVTRAEDFGVNAAAALQLGLAVVGTS